MRVAILGANGQLGTDLVRVLKPRYQETLISLTHKEVEITDKQSLLAMLHAYQPTLVINTPAFHKVEACEEQIERSFEVNTYGVRDLALLCAERNVTLLTMSTDYVFGGAEIRTLPYTEQDPPNPLNVYGVSKLAGEYFVRHLARKYFIVRVSGLYGTAGSSGKGANFVDRMIQLAQEGRAIRVVNDQILTPNPTYWVAKQIEKLIQTENYGLYHATCQGSCSWFDFASEIFNLTGIQAQLFPQTTQGSGAHTLRPRYSVLENAALKLLDLDIMPSWQDGLRGYLRHRYPELIKQQTQIA